MSPGRLGVIALVLGAATWAQLVLVPLVARIPDVPTVIAALCTLAALVTAVLRRGTPSRTAVLALGVYPLTVGLYAFVLGRHAVPRFDAAARVLAALTAVGFAGVTVAWARSAAPRFTVTLAPLDDRVGHPGPSAPAPALRTFSQWVLLGMALFCGVLAPAVLAARPGRPVEEELLRGRHAVVSSAGLLMAVALVLGGGSALVRSAPVKSRLTSRAVGYLAWAVLAWLMRMALQPEGSHLSGFTWARLVR